MSKILPCKQQIIPVSLKRKNSYKGYYIEEWVDVEKIETYFNWLKSNNPFFKDIQLNTDRISMYEQSIVDNIEDYLKTEDNSIDDEINKSHISDRRGDECEEIDETEFTKPIEVNDEINIQYYDSIMCNKYEHEQDEASVPKLYADIITQYEVMQDLEQNYVDDFEQEDKDDMEKDCIEEIFIHPATSTVILDEIASLTTNEIREKAKKRINTVQKKIEKISIAPGEHGKFLNWGDDVFLEERCFPHLFPYGIGGYMSTALDGKDTNMGFTNYVRHRILHVDGRFRNDTVYIFFLLIVKELV